jgi:hypothetical protein
MLIELKPVPSEDNRDLSDWTRAWCEGAAEAGFIELPYEIDTPMLTRLYQYFCGGLAPDEAVHVCFVRMH